MICLYLFDSLDRNDRIQSMQKQSQELKKQNQLLKEVEGKIRAKYDHVSRIIV